MFWVKILQIFKDDELNFSEIKQRLFKTKNFLHYYIWPGITRLVEFEILYLQNE
jgi:hypothetical protein